MDEGSDSGDGISREEYDKLKQWYADTIKRKDEEITRLREQNKALLASAIKQAEQSLPPEGKDTLFGVPYKRDVRVHINDGSKKEGDESSDSSAED